jgi:hypothetical protein
MGDLQQLLAMSPEELEEHLKGMDHSSLYRLRGMLTGNQVMQNKVSPYEHRAFAREATHENPWMAAPIAMGTLAYQPYKMLMGQSRSQPSLDQVGQGLTGVFEGLKKSWF